MRGAGSRGVRGEGEARQQQEDCGGGGPAQQCGAVVLQPLLPPWLFVPLPQFELLALLQAATNKRISVLFKDAIALQSTC